jgi:hypothetical protein
MSAVKDIKFKYLNAPGKIPREKSPPEPERRSSQSCDSTKELNGVADDPNRKKDKTDVEVSNEEPKNISPKVEYKYKNATNITESLLKNLPKNSAGVERVFAQQFSASFYAN